MTDFRKITPNSSLQSANERYQYLLAWLSPTSGVRMWYFSHTNGEQINNNKSFTIEGLNDIRNVPYESREEIQVESRYLSNIEFDYVRSIYQSNRIFQITPTGEQIPISIKQDKTEKPNQLNKYEISFTFTFKEDNTLNV